MIGTVFNISICFVFLLFDLGLNGIVNNIGHHLIMLSWVGRVDGFYDLCFGCKSAMQIETILVMFEKKIKSYTCLNVLIIFFWA